MTTSPTPESNARDIAALTSVVDVLVSQFIRPNAQQANANRETIDEILELLKRQGEVIAGLDIKIDQIATLVQENARAISQLTSTQAEHDQWIQEMRTLQAESNSQMAQLTVKQDRNADAIEQITIKQDRNADAIEQITVKQDRNADAIEQITVKQDRNADVIAEMGRQGDEQQARLDQLVEENRAFRESQQSQLAAIIGNARRIDRLEQQAS